MRRFFPTNNVIMLEYYPYIICFLQ